MYINIHVCKTKGKLGCEFERQQWGKIWGGSRRGKWSGNSVIITSTKEIIIKLKIIVSQKAFSGYLLEILTTLKQWPKFILKEYYRLSQLNRRRLRK